MSLTPKSGVPTLDVENPFREAVAFVVLTFGVAFAAYVPMIAAARGWIAADVPGELAILGVFSPAIAAFVLRAVGRGWAGIRTFFAGLADWRFPARWWVATLFLPLATFAAMYAAYLGLGGEFQVAARVQEFLDAGWTAVFVAPVMALVIVAISFGEEAGWRGYLLPILQTRLNALAASVVLGVVWFAWHVPLAFLPGSENAAFPLPLWGLSIVASAVAYTWLFNNTGGSVLAVTLLHAGYNFWGPMLVLHPGQTGSLLSAYVITGTDVLIALVLVVAFGAATLRRFRRPTPEPATPTSN